MINWDNINTMKTSRKGDRSGEQEGEKDIYTVGYKWDNCFISCCSMCCD